MKKIRLWTAMTCFLLTSVLAAPSLSFAADTYYNDGELDEWTREELSFELTAGSSGEEITKLSSGKVNRNFSTAEEYFDSVEEFSVSVSASMDGSTDSKLYGSGAAYRNAAGKDEYIAALRADASSVWGKDSCMVFQVEDIGDNLCGIEIEMGASKDGPRDYKISYSVDKGETWNEFKQYGTDEGTVRTANCTAKVFRKCTRNLPRRYEKMSLKDDFKEEYEAEVFEDIYFRVSVNSDYKADGTGGLYGSSSGEWGIRSVNLLRDWIGADEPPVPPQDVRAYKTGDRKITLEWRKPCYLGGYEICLKKGSGKYHKIKDITGTSLKKYTVKNLSPKAVYKLRIRSYKMVAGKMRYSRYMGVTVDMRKQPLPRNLSMKKSFSLHVGQEKKVAVKCTKGTDSRYIKKISYKVMDKSIAGVKPSGIIVGKRKGTTTMTVKVILKSKLSKTFTVKLKVNS